MLGFFHTLCAGVSVSKIGLVVIVVHFMYDLPVIKLRSRECRIWVDSGFIIPYVRAVSYTEGRKWKGFQKKK